MPYDVTKDKNGSYVVKKKSTGEVVARPKDEKGLRGFLFHATKGESWDLVNRIDLVLNERTGPVLTSSEKSIEMLIKG